MTKIRIFSEKILFNSFYTKKFISYSNELTDIAKKQNGFISSNSYFVDNMSQINQSNTLKIITISEWKNMNTWELWKKSQNRKYISDQYKCLERSEKFNILYNRSDNDIFLL